MPCWRLPAGLFLARSPLVALDRNGVPYLDDHFGGVVLVRQFTQRDFPHTPLKIDDLGYIRPR